MRRGAARPLDRLVVQLHEPLGVLARSSAGLDERRIVPLTVSSASTRSDAARLAAAAGLLSSCASPAAIVPSEASRSRFDSIAVSRVMTGLMRCMIRRCTGGLARTSSVNRSVGMRARRQSVSQRIRTPSSPPVSAAIAPIQVGASWWPSGSSRDAVDQQRPGAALEQQDQAARRLARLRR